MRLLVANRAEIAVRIMSTAAVLGIETVAVYPDDDAACAHVARAGAAVRLPGAGPAAYLDAGAIVGAGTASGCDTLHPGYGFLAENSDLARRCAAAGIRFAGPAPEVLDLFGDKTAARARAASLGIPLARATDGPASPEEARAFLDSLGPGAAVMVKAVAGGGGRGLRPVTSPAGLDEALRRSSSEAAAAFGDPAVYLEELVTGARHVEVQLIGDGTRVAVLGDRDCSLQRRRQKLIEIAPADLGDDLRARLHEAARRLLASTACTGLATAEFLVTGDRFVFLEVNPRIQVEHTVTEEVTGLDLVELMLRITGGETLAELGLADPGLPDRGLADLTCLTGPADLDRAGVPPPARVCAIQARVNTETLQPDGTVLPASGTLTRFQPPAGRGVRVDTHGYPGYAVSPRYDPLLAKVIATGTGRRSAATRLRRALDEFGLAGVPGNLDLLSALAGHLEDEDLDTTWVEPASWPAARPSRSRSRGRTGGRGRGRRPRPAARDGCGRGGPPRRRGHAGPRTPRARGHEDGACRRGARRRGHHEPGRADRGHGRRRGPPRHPRPAGSRRAWRPGTRSGRPRPDPPRPGRDDPAAPHRLGRPPPGHDRPAPPGWPPHRPREHR